MAFLKRLLIRSGVGVVSYLLLRTGDAVQVLTAVVLIAAVVAYFLVFQPHKDTL